MNNLDIKDIQTLYGNNEVVLTQHFLDRIEKRGIELSQIKVAIGCGEIIEQYPDDFPHPSALILGYSNDIPLHIVVGVGGGFVWLITAYHPDCCKWETNYKTRKGHIK